MKNFAAWFFSKVQEPLLREGMHVARVCMHPSDYTDIRQDSTGEIDLVTSVAALKSGIMANLYGADLIVRREIPPGHFNFEAEDGRRSRIGRICRLGHVEWGAEFTAQGECECPECVVSFVLDT